MDEGAWKWLMLCARQHAEIYNERVRVVAVELPRRPRRPQGRRWVYVIDFPSGMSNG